MCILIVHIRMNCHDINIIIIFCNISLLFFVYLFDCFFSLSYSLTYKYSNHKISFTSLFVTATAKL